MHPKIIDVFIVTFDNNKKKLFDFNDKLEMDRFKQLKNFGIFKKYKIDNGGYGIIFNDDIEQLVEEHFRLQMVSKNLFLMSCNISIMTI